MKINNNFQTPYMANKSVSKPAFGSLQGLGKKILGSKTLQNAGNLLEFDGYNMPLASLVTVCYGGVLIPRLVSARDKNEFKEIMVRDVTSMALLLYGRKAIQNVVSKACSKLSGLALVKYPKNHKNPLQVVYNYLRPEKGVSVLGSADLKSKYTNIDTFKNGIVDFCDFVKTSGGNVAKLFKSDEKLAKTAKEAFIKSGVEGDFESATSEKMIEAFTKLHKSDKQALNGIYEYFKNDKNAIVSKARVMNSSFDCLATFVLVPGLLGFGLPKLTEKNIKKQYKNHKPTTQKAAEKTQDNQQNKNILVTSKASKSAPVFKDFV